jgi:hypothetical protein
LLHKLTGYERSGSRAGERAPCRQTGANILVDRRGATNIAGRVRRMRATGCSSIAIQLLPESKERRKHSEMIASTLGSGERERAR